MGKAVRSIVIKEGHAEVILTKGAVAVIDLDDVPKVDKWNWSLSRWGYAERKQRSGGEIKTVFMHQVVCPTPDGYFADHINGERLDNRKSNLRPATNQQNIMNSRIRASNKYGHKGIYYNKQRGKYEAFIGFNRKKVNLGRFFTLECAIEARREAERMYFGEFATC